MVTSEVVETLSYSCLHCRALLDAPSGGWDGWVRCRSCGRVFLPPEYDRLPHVNREPGVSGPAYVTPLEVGGMPGLQFPQPLTGRLAHTSPARLFFTTGFVLCLLLTLIAFLDFTPGKLAIFGLLTIGFFLLLLRTPRKRLPPTGATWIHPEVEATTDKDASPISNS